MFSTSFVYFALLQVAYSLAIAQPRDAASSNDLATRSPHLQKRMETGVKVALGICIPGAVLVVGLGLVVLLMYPAQLKKLRRQNPGAEIGLNELMTGKVTQRPAPPPYSANHRDSAADDSSMDAPAYEPPKPVQTATTTVTPTAPAEARHSALMS